MIPTVAAVLLLTAQASLSHPALATARIMTVDDAIARDRSVASTIEFGPIVRAASAVAIDIETRRVLTGVRIAARRPLASITKLLTALVVVRSTPSWEALVLITEEDVPPEGGTVLAVGDQLTIADLLTALLIRSDNTAAHALARTVAGSRAAFRDRMQMLAAEMELRSVRVFDPAGLDPRNVGSAMDVARLVIAALEEPEVAVRSRQRDVVVDGHRTDRARIRIRTTNRLLDDLHSETLLVVGGKTGYLDEAMYNIAFVAARGSHRVAVALLGGETSDDRFRDARIMAGWALRRLEE